MAVPPINKGFPPPQPSSMPGGDSTAGAAGVPDDVLQRERDYQDLLEKRNKLFLDPAPVRAMAMLRAETDKATEAERKYGVAVKDRLAAFKATGFGVLPTGNGVTGPMFGGPQMPGQMQPRWQNPPANAHQALGARPPSQEQESQGTSRINWWETGKVWGGKAAGVVGAVGRAAQTAGHAIDTFATPFTDDNTRTWNTINSLDPTGAVGGLRRVQLALQRHGAGTTMEELARMNLQTTKLGELRDLPLEQFRIDYDPERVRAGVLAGDPMHSKGVWPNRDNPRLADKPDWMTFKALGQMRDAVPDDALRFKYPTLSEGYGWFGGGDRRRDTVAGEQRYREASSQLGPSRASAEETRQLDAQKASLEMLIVLRKRFDDQREAAIQKAKEYGESADKRKLADDAKKDRAHAVDEAKRAIDFGQKATEVEDRIKTARERVASQENRVRMADMSGQQVSIANLTAREQTAAEQSQRVGYMGPGEMMQSQAMFQLVKQMQEQGQDLSMLPGEVKQMARVFAPQTTDKMMEASGADVIRRKRAAGEMPQAEYRDDLPVIRGEMDAAAQKLDKTTLDGMKLYHQGVLKAFTEMRSRFEDLDKFYRDALRQIELNSLYQSQEGSLRR